MTNLFLKVNKDLFKLGLNPTEILLLAQIIEFNTNTGDFFMSDKALAEQFGVSESTIKREIKALEELGFITRETKNVKGGKERHIKVNQTSVNLSLDSNKSNALQGSNCSLTSVKMSFDKEQIDTIKDNIKDNSKDNICVLLSDDNKTGTAPGGSSIQKPVSELTEKEKMEKFKKEYGF